MAMDEKDKAAFEEAQAKATELAQKLEEKTKREQELNSKLEQLSKAPKAPDKKPEGTAAEPPKEPEVSAESLLKILGHKAKLYHLGSELIDPELARLAPEVQIDPSTGELTDDSKKALDAWKEQKKTFFRSDSQAAAQPQGQPGGARPNLPPAISFKGTLMSAEYAAEVRRTNPKLYASTDFQTAYIAWMRNNRNR